MKKLIVTILILVFAATTASYAGLYKSRTAGDNSYSGGIYSNPSANAEEKDWGSGIYRSSDPDPGGRPDSGGGIGQEDGDDAPLGDGLIVFVACSALLVITKGFAKKFFRRNEDIKRAIDSFGRRRCSASF